MSAVAAVFGPGLRDEDEGLVRQMLARASRGTDIVAVWRGPQVMLGVARHSWELGADFSGGVTVLEEDGVVIAADASLYYRQDLASALRGAGHAPRGPSVSHLLLAAYRAWGVAAFERLEGDFAFVLWDGRAPRLLGARDFHGTRPLFHAAAGERLLVASSLRSVGEVPGVSRALNLAAIAEDVASLSSVALTETAFSAVQRLPAGWLFEAPSPTDVRARAFWTPPLFESWDGTPMDEAALALRDVLTAAVTERCAGQGPTAVWLSGGYDSTAVLASGVAGGKALQAISMSYPEGDPGREDERIVDAARHCGVPVEWVQSGAIGAMHDGLAWGRGRDEPAAHAFAPWNEALARATMGQTARVALNGNGGDQFFGVSPVFLADLLRSGGWLRLLNEARALGIGTARGVATWAVLPGLSDGLANFAGRVRGNRVPRHYLQEQVPSWLRDDFVQRTGLLERRRPRAFRRSRESHAAAESAWYLQGSFGPRIIAQAAGLTQAHGVEARSPLYDGRVIALAARRPREERCGGGEKKRLLRRAMKGLLPDSLLARRATRTGLPGGWLRRWLLDSLTPLVDSVGRQCMLADLGMVEPSQLQGAWRVFQERPEWESKRGGEVFHALAAECWLQVQQGLGSGGRPALVA